MRQPTAPPPLPSPQFTAKQLQRESLKAERDGNKYDAMALDDMSKGKMEMARLHAQQAKSAHNQHTSLQHTAARIEMVAGRCVWGGSEKGRAGCQEMLRRWRVVQVGAAGAGGAMMRRVSQLQPGLPSASLCVAVCAVRRAHPPT